MKYLLTILLLAPFVLSAQNISIKSFRVVQDDMTARVTAPVTDQNGDKCALVKIRTTQRGFVFEGDMLGITKTLQETGEVWVYLPAKAKKLTIKHPTYGVLDNYIYPENIKEATVYVMELITSGSENEDDVDVKSAYLIVKSDPSGADVYIDDAYMGTTPFNKKLIAGSYTYRVEKNMYYSDGGKIVISGENSREELSVDLKPAFALVNITTIPDQGATIIIDGNEIDIKSPADSVKLKSGLHRIQVKMPLFQPAMKEVEVSEGQTFNVEIPMIPNSGIVNIATTPEADIFIDGEKVGTGTYKGRVMAGLHVIEAKHLSYSTEKKQIEIVAGSDKNISFNMRPAFGSLDITTNPIDANFFINGENKGKTPNEIKKIEAGAYNLKIEKAGYQTIEKPIVIKENQTTSISEKLHKAKIASVNNTEKIDIQAYTMQAKKYKRNKTVLYIVSGISAGVGAYFAYSANNLYTNDYPNATTNATDLHKQIESQDVIWKTAFGVGAVALVPAIIFRQKEKKITREYNLSLKPSNNALGLGLTYNF